MDSAAIKLHAADWLRVQRKVCRQSLTYLEESVESIGVPCRALYLSLYPDKKLGNYSLGSSYSGLRLESRLNFGELHRAEP